MDFETLNNSTTHFLNRIGKRFRTGLPPNIKEQCLSSFDEARRAFSVSRERG